MDRHPNTSASNGDVFCAMVPPLCGRGPAADDATAAMVDCVTRMQSVLVGAARARVSLAAAIDAAELRMQALLAEQSASCGPGLRRSLSDAVLATRIQGEVFADLDRGARTALAGARRAEDAAGGVGASLVRLRREVDRIFIGRSAPSAELRTA